MIAIAGDDESHSCANDLARPYYCLVDIRDLDYFLACCKSGSFTAAAREVHIVQSAMSCAIARLEKELGATLFDRNVSPLVVTEHGAALQGPAQRILDAKAPQ